MYVQPTRLASLCNQSIPLFLDLLLCTTTLLTPPTKCPRPPYTSYYAPPPFLHLLPSTTTLLTPPLQCPRPPYTSCYAPPPSLHLLLSAIALLALQLCTTTLLTPPTKQYHPPYTSYRAPSPSYSSSYAPLSSSCLLPSPLALLTRYKVYYLFLCTLAPLMPPTMLLCPCTSSTFNHFRSTLAMHPNPPYPSYHALVSLYFIHLPPFPQHLGYAPSPPLCLLPCSCVLVLHPPPSTSAAP